MTWFCIRTATRQENRAIASLKALGVQFYMPTEIRWRDTPKGRKKVSVPLIAGFVFACLPTDEAYQHAIAADGVSGVLKFGGRPAIAKASEIMWLAFHESQGAFDRTWSPTPIRWNPRVGQLAKVTSGQYTGFVGKVLQTRGKNRALLLVHLFGRPQKIERPISELQAA